MERDEGTRDLGQIFDFEGRPDHALAADYLSVPWRIELQQGVLVYQLFERDREGKLAAPIPTIEQALDEKRTKARGQPSIRLPNPRVLDGFMRLRDATDEQVLDFARRWGVLDLCEHDFPATHNVGSLAMVLRRSPKCLPVQPGSVEGRESVKAWRAWAQRAHSLMLIGARLNTNRPGRIEDWERFFEGIEPNLARFELGPRGVPFRLCARSVEQDWLLLGRYVNAWIALAQFAPKMYWRRGKALIRYGARTQWGRLFGVLGMQMMVRLSKVGGHVLCAGCSTQFKPKKIPHPMRGNYCDDCRRKRVPQKLARASFNDRKRMALELHAQGLSVADIAERTGSRESTVCHLVGSRVRDARRR